MRTVAEQAVGSHYKRMPTSRTRPRDSVAIDEALDWRNSNLGRLAFAVAQVYERALLEWIRAAGHTDIRISHLTLFRSLDLAGTRLTALAERAGVTLPTMQQIVDSAVVLNLVSRIADPMDGRAKLVQFTERGHLILRILEEGVAQLEVEVEQVIGSAARTRLARDLLNLLHAKGVSLPIRAGELQRED
jgi:DNA-binding MarR family transcriptional regulator